MMRSYRESDERAGDRVVYFDYARSLAAGARPTPWRWIAAITLGSVAAVGTVAALAYALVGALSPSIFLMSLVALVSGVAMIPLMRSNRRLSGDNLVEARRHPAPPVSRRAEGGPRQDGS